MTLQHFKIAPLTLTIGSALLLIGTMSTEALAQQYMTGNETYQGTRAGPTPQPVDLDLTSTLLVSGNNNLIKDANIFGASTKNNWYGIGVDGSGSELTITDSQLTGTNSSYAGINQILKLDNGGQVTVRDSVFLTSSMAGLTLDRGSVANLHNVKIVGTGDSVNVSTDSTLNIYGGAIDVEGIGLKAANTGSTIRLNIDGSGVATGERTSINTKNAVGISVMLVGTVVGSGVDLKTEGDNAYGMQVNSNGQVRLTDSTLDTQGVGVYGVVAHGLGTASARVWLTDSSVKTHGEGAYGLFAMDSSNRYIITDHTSIETEGNSGIGAYVRRGSRIELNNGSSIVTKGDSAHGAMVRDGATLLINNSIIDTQGANSIGIASRADTGLTNIITANHGQVSTADADAITIRGGITELSLQNSVISGGNGILMSVDVNSTNVAGVVNLAADHSVLNGAVITATGNTSNLTLTNSTAWNMQGSSNVTTLTNNGSTINFAAPVSGSFKTLTINGNYTANDGRLVLNTKLGDDASATDKLIVEGDTGGHTRVSVLNAGGGGAPIVSDGIQIVRVDGQSNGTFALGNRVTAGAYEYVLYKGGVGANAGDGNWYLRNLLAPSPVPRPETGVYLSNLQAASTMFVHTLHDRLGEPQYTDSYKGSDNTPAAWVRVSSSHTENKAGGGLIDMETDTSLVHFGGDLARWSNNGNDRWHLGLMGAYGKSDIDANPNYSFADGLHRSASGKVEGYSVGAYATWYGNQDKPTGPYVDFWTQYGWYDNKVNGYGQPEEKYNSTGVTVSIEGGYAFIAKGGETRDWMIEPQVQLAYNGYSADDHKEANGTWVRNGDSDGVIARLGTRVYSRSKLNDNGIQPFVEANWWYNDVKNSMTFDGVAVNDDTPDNRYELKVGLQGEIAKGWQLWGHIGGQWGENSYNRYEGMVGMKKLF